MSPVSLLRFLLTCALGLIQPAVPTVPPRFLTSGSWDVTALCALDEAAGKMYVKARGGWGGGGSPLSAFNKLTAPFIASASGRRWTSAHHYTVYLQVRCGQRRQMQRRINLREQLNGHDSFKDDWVVVGGGLHVVLISAKRLKEIALAWTLLVATCCH